MNNIELTSDQNIVVFIVHGNTGPKTIEGSKGRKDVSTFTVSFQDIGEL